MAEPAASRPRTRNWLERIIAWGLTLKPTRVWLHYVENRGFMLADSITYRALFSVFAGVLLGFSLAGLWLDDNPVAWEALVRAVDTAIPGLIGEEGVIDLSTIVPPEGLTLAGIASLVALVFASIGAIGSLRASLRRLSGEAHDDAFWVWVILRNALLALAIGGGFVVSAGVAVVGTAFIEALGEWLGLSGGVVAALATTVGTVVVVFLLDTGLIALMFVSLSGVRARPRTLWVGALIGGLGLTVLQQLSGLFVRGAGANPLLASFTALIALLIWFNLSAQVILVSSTWIIIGSREDQDRVRTRHGAPTFELRRVRKAEDRVRIATEELRRAREAEKKARTGG